MADRTPLAVPSLSVIVPVYNEEGNIPLFLNRMTKVLQDLACPYEIIFSMDPCTDGTERVILESRQKDPRIKLLKFSRRFGQPAATLAGLHYATGDACVVIDVDLQDPPELIAQMVAKYREGYHVAYAQRISRKGESPLRKLVATSAYWVINRISSVPIPRNTGDFRLLSRTVVDELKKLKEGHGFLRGLVGLVGYSQIAIPYNRDERAVGETKYPVIGSIRIGFNGIVGFSSVPLQVISVLGFLFLGLGVLTSGLWLLSTFTSIGPAVSGLVPFIFVMSGVQSLGLGILGEYVGRIYDEVRDRPLFRVQDAHGFDGPPRPPAR